MDITTPFSPFIQVMLQNGNEAMININQIKYIRAVNGADYFIVNLGDEEDTLFVKGDIRQFANKARIVIL